MKLHEAVARMDTLDRSAVLFVRRPWTQDAECIVGPLDDDLRVPHEVRAAGYEYFLDIPVAREVLAVFGNKPPTKEERLRLLIHYAENDAYPEWVAHR